MDKKIIDLKEISKNKKIYGNNAKLYLTGDEVIKIFNNSSYRNARALRKKNSLFFKEKINPSDIEFIDQDERVLEEIANISRKEFVIPNSILYSKKIATEYLEGYSMDNLNDYVELCESNIKRQKFIEKMLMCKEVCDAITSLERSKLAYWDVHSSNIMVNGKDFKFIDVDSVKSRKVNGDFAYRKYLACSYFNLSLLVLSVLYNVDEVDLRNLIDDEHFRQSKQILKNAFFNRLINYDGKIFYPIDYLDYINEDYINETEHILRRQNFY